MTVPIDPWRTLGLAPGSSLEQVRRAYRQLAKANHPDAAGEAALPRFLAIQAAYEQIVAGRRPGARPPGRARAEAAEPWRADPDR
ncbi:MAG TPA: J domain-containing protein, partial [Candidatus Limnocylindrales bacterium]|nr:J domain-containing protein [Candidatus Limnocylindrales bacterium]